MPSVYIPDSIQKSVWKRANFYCEYCYAPSEFAPDDFEFDHIFPISLGGNSKAGNLAIACGKCNNCKSNHLQHIDPLTNRVALLFHPRKDLWTDHFQWNEDFTLIEGISPVGRATADLLQVNRQSNINLRNLLLLVGYHPPKGYPKN